MSNPETLAVAVFGATTYLTRDAALDISFIDHVGGEITIPSSPELSRLFETLSRGSGIVRIDH